MRHEEEYVHVVVAGHPADTAVLQPAADGAKFCRQQNTGSVALRLLKRKARLLPAAVRQRSCTGGVRLQSYTTRLSQTPLKRKAVLQSQLKGKGAQARAGARKQVERKGGGAQLSSTSSTGCTGDQGGAADAAQAKASAVKLLFGEG